MRCSRWRLAQPAERQSPRAAMLQPCRALCPGQHQRRLLVAAALREERLRQGPRQRGRPRAEAVKLSAEGCHDQRSISEDEGPLRHGLSRALHSFAQCRGQSVVSQRMEFRGRRYSYNLSAPESAVQSLPRPLRSSGEQLESANLYQ